MELFDMVHIEATGSASKGIKGTVLPKRYDAVSFDPSSGLVYTIDATLGGMYVMSPPNQAARDSFGLVRRLGEAISSHEGEASSEASKLLSCTPGGVVARLIMNQMTKAYRAGAANGRTIGLPPRDFALLLLSSLVQRSTLLV